MRTLGILLFMLPFAAFSQSPDPFERIFEQMENRMDEMMQRFGADPRMRELFEDDFNHFGMSHSAFDYHYDQDKKGRTLVIKPHTKENNFKIICC